VPRKPKAIQIFGAGDEIGEGVHLAMACGLHRCQGLPSSAAARELWAIAKMDAAVEKAEGDWKLKVNGHGDAVAAVTVKQEAGRCHRGECPLAVDDRDGGIFCAVGGRIAWRAFRWRRELDRSRRGTGLLLCGSVRVAGADVEVEYRGAE